MNHFCTISSPDYLYKVNALHETLMQSCASAFQLHVLVTDNTYRPQLHNITFLNLKSLSTPKAKNIIGKYSDNKLRWSLKPLLMLEILQQFEKAIYVDNDIAFFNEPEFLFQELIQKKILLTPHRFSFSTTKDQYWLENNLKFGLFNAGFVGANNKATQTLEWWADACLYRCEKNFWRGLYDDQKYLDLFPIMEPATKIIEHKGCNVASWNIENCERNTKNGETLVGGYPIIFIHFNHYTIRKIMEGSDHQLIPYWKKYVETLKKFKPGINEKQLYKPASLSEKLRVLIWHLLSKF